MKNFSRKVNITDSTVNSFLNSVDYELFDDKFLVDTRITIGDLLLLYYIKDLIIDEHEILFSTGYKSS